MNYILYDKITGEILRVGVCSEDVFELQKQEATVEIMEGIANDLVQYVFDGVVTDKVENPAEISKTIMLANGVDTAIISNLPNPTTVWFDGVEYTVTDGIFEFTVDTPGELRIRCESFPYLDKEFMVNAS